MGVGGGGAGGVRVETLQGSVQEEWLSSGLWLWGTPSPLPHPSPSPDNCPWPVHPMAPLSTLSLQAVGSSRQGTS